MNYTTLLTHTQTLAASYPDMAEFAPAKIDYEATQSFDTLHDILDILSKFGEVTGWIVWPNQVESITQARSISASEDTPLIEAELLSSKGDTLRVHYHAPYWKLIIVRVTPLNNADDANALIEPISLAARHKNEPSLYYSRVWQLDQEQGMITTDAVFTGFGGKQ